MNLNRSTDNMAKVQQYLQNSTRYYDNSQDLIRRKELAKGGELLWGAIAEATKALHLMVKDKPLKSHADIGKYLKNLLLQYSDAGQIKREYISAAHQTSY